MSHVPILSTLFHHDTPPNFRMVITTVLMVEMIMNAKGQLFHKANHKRCEITNITDNILGRGGDEGHSQSIGL